jgi:DNA-binding response OmpR family regulator
MSGKIGKFMLSPTRLSVGELFSDRIPCMCQILIAEDEARLAAFIEKGLRRNGFSTAIAEDGQQALEMVEEGEFALLLLDLGLPIKDGWSVMRELRQHDDQLPIIVVTAVSEDHRKAAIASGANDFLTKPFRFSDLLAKIKVYLNQ